MLTASAVFTAALSPSQYYDIPVVSLRAAAWRLMSAGIEGYKVTRTPLVVVFCRCQTP